MSAADPVNESQTQIRRVDAALRFMNVYARLFAQSLHGEHFFRLGSPHYLVGNRINTEGGWISSDRLRCSENPGLLALKLFDCERTAITQLNKSLKLTGYVTHKSQLYRVGGAISLGWPRLRFQVHDGNGQSASNDSRDIMKTFKEYGITLRRRVIRHG